MARRHYGPGTHRELFPTLPSRPARLTGQTRTRSEAPATTAPAALSPVLWLCVQCTDLPLAAVRREADPQPVAVITQEGNSAWIETANAAAAAMGVTPGLSLSAACALSPQLETLTRSAAREAALLESVASFCQRFSSQVSIEAPDAWLLEIRGSLRLFGGSGPLLEQLLEGLQTFGLTPRWAVSPAPLASLWLVRAGGGQRIGRVDQLPGAVGELPLYCTGWPEKLLRTLSGMGLKTVRDCLRLPRDGFARRFGRGRLAELDRAVGRLAEPRKLFDAPAVFTTCRDLDARIESLDRVLHALEPLLDAMALFLRVRERALEHFDVVLEHGDDPATRLTVRLAGLTRDAGRFRALLGERFEHLQLSGPVTAVALEARELHPLCGHDGDLFARSGQSAPWPQLVERLRARLGENAVRGLSLLAEHRPEHAWRYVEPGQAGASLPVTERPLWLLESSRALSQQRGYPWMDGRLTLLRGPERIESGWWSGQDVARDYYVARCPRGTLVWLYRSRRPPHDWHVHGIFG